MTKEEKISKYADMITANSTTLLMISVIFYFFTLLFGFVPTYSGGQVNGSIGYILGSASLGAKNLIPMSGLGALIALINTILMALVRLFAGLSFAAVCFDESKNIWFRVVSVAALMLIMFGGLQLF